MLLARGHVGLGRGDGDSLLQIGMLARASRIWGSPEERHEAAVGIGHAQAGLDRLAQLPGDSGLTKKNSAKGSGSAGADQSPGWDIVPPACCVRRKDFHQTTGKVQLVAVVIHGRNRLL